MPLETSFEPVGPHLQGDDSENQLNHQMPIRGHRLHRYGSQMEHYAHLALLNRPTIHNWNKLISPRCPNESRRCLTRD